MKPSQIAQALTACILAHRPAMIWGASGVGKSDVVQQVTDKLKIECRDVRISSLDPTDARGFPCPDLKAGTMRWLPASFLPQKGKGLLFLDEMNLAPASVQASFYQLMLTRRIGEYVLPPGWDIAAAGNRDSDRANVIRMPGPLANRMVHLDYEADLDEWVAHARASGISDETIGFIRFRRNLLHAFNAQSKDPAFPSPRTWFFADQFARQRLAPEIEHELIKGSVGEGAAIEYMAYMRHVKDLPTLKEIQDQPLRAIVPTSPSAQHAITTMLGTAVTEATFATYLKYVERLPEEFCVVFIRDARETCVGIKNDKAYKEWGLKNREIMLG